jgi:hypothetical protein
MTPPCGEECVILASCEELGAGTVVVGSICGLFDAEGSIRYVSWMDES